MSKVAPFIAPQFSDVVSVTSGQGVSTTIDIQNRTLVGLLLGTMTSTTVTFQVSSTLGGTYVNLVDGAGSTVSKTIPTGGGYVYLDPNIFAGIRFVQLTFGSNEGSTRSVTLVTRPIV